MENFQTKEKIKKAIGKQLKDVKKFSKKRKKNNFWRVIKTMKYENKCKQQPKKIVGENKLQYYCKGNVPHSKVRVF